ncbi:4764_t:CDS:2 [Entrophospora sp. SA101]|nr:4764_t:CDS:2 [Entrophospora sp. SA101]
MIVFNSCKYLRELDAAENVIKELVTLKGNNISMAYLSINNYPLEFLDFVNCVKLTNLNLDKKLIKTKAEALHLFDWLMI